MSLTHTSDFVANAIHQRVGQWLNQGLDDATGDLKNDPDIQLRLTELRALVYEDLAALAAETAAGWWQVKDLIEKGGRP